MKKKKQEKTKNNKLRVIFGTFITLIVLIGSAYLSIPIFKNINYGLDLQGGFEVLYEIEPLDGNKLTSDMVYNTYKAILKRVDILGVNEPEIAIEDNNNKFIICDKFNVSRKLLRDIPKINREYDAFELFERMI